MSTTLHEHEREVGEDRSRGDYWAQTRRRILESWAVECTPESILEVGCGSGYLAAHLGGGTGANRVVGLDRDAESVGLAADRRGVTATLGDARRLPYRSGTFDCVVAGDVIEHFADPGPALRECRRVLRAEGALLVSVPAFRWLWGPHDRHGGHTDRYTADRLADTVAEAGFTLDEYRYTNALPLPAYFLTQRVLKAGIPGGARGSHAAPVEWLKRLMVAVETAVPFPVGITLLARCSPA